MSRWISLLVILLLGSAQHGVCDLIDSATYKLAYAGAEQPCQGLYLSYQSKLNAKDDVPFLTKGTGAGVAAPGIWQVRVQGNQQISLKAVSISGCCPPKLGYSSRCSSTAVKLNGGVDLNTLWKAVAVNKTSGIYEIIPDQLSGCDSVAYSLGIISKSSGAISSSACGHSVSLVQRNTKKTPGQESTTLKPYWKFIRVKAPAAPPPKRPAKPPPQPPGVPEKTTVISVAVVTLPNNQPCSSLSQAELQNITQTLCTRQISYTVSQGWPKKQTFCEGTAHCRGITARQSSSNNASSSEHTTNFTMIYTPEQNQTASDIADNLSEAITDPQPPFYGGTFPPGTAVNSSESAVVPPGGQLSPSPSPAPSPSPSSSPNAGPSPDFNTVPDNVFPSPSPTPVPVPVPVPVPPPLSAPTNVNAGTVTFTSWTTTFTSATSAQSYKIQCFPPGPGTCGDLVGIYGTALNSAAAGTLTASISTLSAVSTYSCYVISYSGSGGTGNFLCSSPATAVQTPPPPPTSVASAATYPTPIAWIGKFDGVIGAQSYRAKCVSGGGNCDAAGIFGSVRDDPSAGVCTTLPVVELVPGVQYDCFVISYANTGGTGPSSCSAPAFPVLAPPPGAVTSVTTVNTDCNCDCFWAASWDTSPAVGALSYKFNCFRGDTNSPGRKLLNPTPACASNGGIYSSVIDSSLSGGSITLPDLFNYRYNCYVISYANANGTGSYSCTDPAKDVQFISKRSVVSGVVARSCKK